MYRIAILLAFTLVLGCTPSEETPATETPTAEAAPMEEASFEGEWDAQALVSGTDSVLVSMGLTGSDSAEGWSLIFDHLDEPVGATQAVVSGDSATVTFAPYNSALRENLSVTVTATLHVVGDQINGQFAAVYEDGGEIEGDLRAMR